MRALTAAQLLTVWEQGAEQPPVQRALLLLAAASPDDPAEDLARLTVGERDGRLLTLREWTFGSQLASVTDCPACQERLELSFNTSDIRVEGPERGDGPSYIDGLVFERDGYAVRYRLPNSLDLIAATGSPSAEAGRQALIERCFAEASYQGAALTAQRLPAGLVEGVIEAMREADPQADLTIDLNCPACGHRWQAQMDILAYFWNEIEAWAFRTLQEVHRLALAYGWSEADILALSARRRQMYLAMI